MRNDYEEKIFEFYSDQENLKTMVEVVEAFPKVANRIIEEFWLAVREQLQANYPTKEGWIVGFSNSEFAHGVNKLWVYHKDWAEDSGYPLMAVAFEELHLHKDTFVGVFLHHESIAYDALKLRETIISIPELSNFYADNKNKWWAKREFLSPKVTSKQMLPQLVSDEKDDVINSIAQKVSPFLNVMKNHAVSLKQQYKR